MKMVNFRGILTLFALSLTCSAVTLPNHKVNPGSQWHSKRAANDISVYEVDGKSIPEVNFDIGISYAGLIPIRDSFRVKGGRNETRELFFWYFPSSNPKAGNEITIWLNGGPGCSSMNGLMNENGPFTWRPGMAHPEMNYWGWTNLTNMVYIEQPVGTGYSVGTHDLILNEIDVAQEFLGFWINFIETFGFQNANVYLTGESYAGFYVPYIADAMLNKNDTVNFNLQGTLIYDPEIGNIALQFQTPWARYLDYMGVMMPLNSSVRVSIREMEKRCGYADFMDQYYKFPPTGHMPYLNESTTEDCNMRSLVLDSFNYVNPCYNIYHLTESCPVPNDQFNYPANGIPYFNRSDVQKVLNVPPTNWQPCNYPAIFKNTTDRSPPSSQSVLPGVIERSKRTIIGQGLADGEIIPNGTLLAIQNMTWGGKIGFQNPVSTPFFAPYRKVATFAFDTPELPFGAPGSFRPEAAVGEIGKYVTERGLTYVEVNLAGHMLPQYSPAAAYRHLEFLLGRVDGIGEDAGGWTTFHDEL